MVITVNKTTFSLRKILITISKSQTWGTPCMILSLHHEKHHSSLFVHLLPSLLLPLKHMPCNVFTHKILFGINICHLMFLQCVWIQLHLSSLTNIENLTRKFGQSVQICCRENEKEENNGNSKAFYVTYKLNKIGRSLKKAVRIMMFRKKKK